MEAKELGKVVVKKTMSKNFHLKVDFSYEIGENTKFCEENTTISLFKEEMVAFLDRKHRRQQDREKELLKQIEKWQRLSDDPKYSKVADRVHKAHLKNTKAKLEDHRKRMELVKFQLAFLNNIVEIEK